MLHGESNCTLGILVFFLTKVILRYILFPPQKNSKSIKEDMFCVSAYE